MRAGILSATLAISGIVFFLLGGGDGTGNVSAVGLLLNGDFEAWDAQPAPTDWNAASGTSVTQVTSPALGTYAVQIDGAGSLSQSFSASPGATYTVDVMAIVATGTAILRVRFFDSSAIVVGQSFASANPLVGWQAISLGPVAPPGTSFATVILEATATAVFDDAMADEGVVPSPTPTPGDLDTPTPTATATRTSTSTRTATPTRTPTATPTREFPAAPESPTNTPTPVRRTPTPPPPAPPLPGVTFGGLLVNGDFERVASGLPAFWNKFGGTLYADTFAYRGERAATLLSASSSTKWIYQVVNVEPGRWYGGRAYALLGTDDGEAFIRLSWYSTPDGSGTALAYADSNISRETKWTLLETTPVQAPAGAHTVRVRLILRPHGPASAAFDDASFLEVTPPFAPGPSNTPGPDDTEADPDATAAAATQTPAPLVAAAVQPVLIPASGTQPAGTGQPEGAGQTAASDAGTIVISEVMSDPAEDGRDTPYEWVELYNAGDEVVELGEWKLGDSKALDLLPPFALAPGTYVVVAGTAAVFADGVQVIRLDDGEIGLGLNNDGDRVRLIRPRGDLADEVAYGTEAGPAGRVLKAPGRARSLALQPGAAEQAGWLESLAPSPGGRNPAVDGQAPAVSPAAVAARPVDSRAPSAVTIERGRPSDAPAWILGICVAAGIGGSVYIAARAARKR